MTDGEKFDLILEEMRGMKSDMQDMKSEMKDMKSEMQKLEQKVTGIKLHLENVTDRNISLVAEGHMDLNRKLGEALKVEYQKENWGIRLNILEEEVRIIKEQLPVTA